MAQLFLLCLILADAFLGLAMATKTTQQPILQTKTTKLSNPPALSPSTSRKLGKYFKSYQETAFSPAEAPQPTREATVSSLETAAEENVNVQVSPEEEMHLKKNIHHSVDKSIAGGGVILGGLATTFLVTIFCYIRATRRHKTDNQSQTQTTV